MGLPSPDPSSVSPLYSTEFVDPPTPHEQIRWYSTDSAEMFSAYTQEVNLKVL